MLSTRYFTTLTNSLRNHATISVVLGAQLGDEGKGKLVELLGTEADVVCRFQGGQNAGHTVIVNGTKYYFELLPSAFHLSNCVNIIGNGCVVDLLTLKEEIKEKEIHGCGDWSKRLLISDRAHLTFNFHREIDVMMDRKRGQNKIVTTKNGIGPCYSSKVIRNGIRMMDLMGCFDIFAEKLKDLFNYHKNLAPDLKCNLEETTAQFKELAEYFRPITTDTIYYLNKCIKDSSKKIIVEGAQATMLDIDFGVYPHVTSSNSSIGGVLTGLGLPPKSLTNIYGVVRAYTYRLGNGILPTELKNDIGEYLFTRGNEQADSDGVNGRCGWLDLVVVKYTNMINGYTALCLTKLDILDELSEIKVAVAYKRNGVVLESSPASIDKMDDIEVEYVTLPGWRGQSTTECRTFDSLPKNAQRYVQFIEKFVGVPVKWIGVGRERAATIRVF